MKRITKAHLEELGIFNPYGLAQTQPEPKVFIVYYIATSGLGSSYAQWVAYRPGHRIGRDGGKSFSIPRPREQKESQRLAAIAWATERWGVKGWEKSPFGSWHPKGTLERLEETR